MIYKKTSMPAVGVKKKKDMEVAKSKALIHYGVCCNE